MGKIIRVFIPFIVAFLFLGIFFWQVGIYSQALASEDSISKSWDGRQFNKNMDEPQNNIMVTTLEDELNNDGDCSLREAIQAANTNTPVDACGAGNPVITDTIIFGVAGTISVNSRLTVTDGGPVVIDGGDVITTSGGGLTGVWWIDTTGDLTLQNLGVTNGAATDPEVGGGIYNAGTITIKGSTISSSSATWGGGICNEGTMTVMDSTISGNEATFGGGLDNSGVLSIVNSNFISNDAIAGGGLNNNSLGGLTITGSIFMSNNASDGGGIRTFASAMTIANSTVINNSGYAGGGLYSGEHSTLTISQCDVSYNIAHIGAGVYNNISTLDISNSTLMANNADYGGGIHVSSASAVTITNSTLSGNFATEKGGGINNDEYGWINAITITNSTLSNNLADYGGGIYNGGQLSINFSTLALNNASIEGGSLYNLADRGEAMLNSTILAYSLSGANCAGSQVNDNGYNMEDADSCQFNPANGSQPNTDPMLDALQDNGGPAWTHALLPGSPAIDAGDNASCPPTDQRGVSRPIDGDADGLAICDIGSYEVMKKSFLPLVIKRGGEIIAPMKPPSMINEGLLLGVAMPCYSLW
jgi:CSLREA domain-containing protein